MSGIYISGIKMPEKEQLVIFRIWGNGQVERLEGYRPFLLYGVKATDIPNHGRLIDADALVTVSHYDDHDVCVVDLDDIINAPTIIPASEEGE